MIALAAAATAIGLTDLLPELGGWCHAALLALLGATALWAAGRGWRRFRPVTGEAALRRLERDADLPHRPLQSLTDHPATGDMGPLGRALWRHHQTAALGALRRLRPPVPNDPPSDSDPWALRGLAALLLVVGIAVTGPDWTERLAAAVSPSLSWAEAAPAPRVDLFITPPEYTGRAPIYLDSAAPTTVGAPEILEVPRDSIIEARVSGGDIAPVLSVGGDDFAFELVTADAYEASAAITGGNRLTVAQDGRELASWPMTVRDDSPPTATFDASPVGNPQGVLEVHGAAADDYGVTGLRLDIALSDPTAAPASVTWDESTFAIPSPAPETFAGVGFFDTAPHPWAGLDVAVSLVAEDAAGQSGASEEVRMVLPERQFTHPVAAAIVEQRRILVRNPDQARQVAEGLERISTQPDAFGREITVFLALRTAAARLALGGPPAGDAYRALADLLWDAALRLEDGDLSLAAAALREAERALREALANGADPEVIEERMAELRAALNAYLDALAMELSERIARGESVPMSPSADQLNNRGNLNDLLDRLEALSESGAREEAMALLDQLQSFMEGAQGMMQSAPSEASEMVAEALELIDDLQALVEAQRALLEETHEMTTGEDPTGGGQEGAQELAEAQEALRRQLGDLMLGMNDMIGEIPTEYGDAEQAMRRAERALDSGLPSLATDPQAEALDHLTQGLQSFAQSFMDMMAGGSGMALVPGGGGEEGRDPFGRQPGNNGQMSTEDVAIPDEAEIQRAREILNELRRRFGEYERPLLEREYIERLLRQF